jgi:hypothetical protein
VTIPDIDGEEPELVEIRFVQFRQDRIGLAAPRAIAGRHHERRPALRVLEFRQEGPQEAETPDVPVVWVAFDGGLQQEVKHVGILGWTCWAR